MLDWEEGEGRGAIDGANKRAAIAERQKSGYVLCDKSLVYSLIVSTYAHVCVRECVCISLCTVP